jgi:nucleoid-associated protein YgaU
MDWRLQMKQLLSIAAVTLMAFGAGCSSTKTADNSKLQPTPAVATVNPPAPQETMVSSEQPLVVDTRTPSQPAIDASPISGPTGGGTYTVKHGDTLFHIAAVSYGSGGQWKKIVAANPGVDPKHLKVGQKLVIP